MARLDISEDSGMRIARKQIVCRVAMSGQDATFHIWFEPDPRLPPRVIEATTQSVCRYFSNKEGKLDMPADELAYLLKTLLDSLADRLYPR